MAEIKNFLPKSCKIAIINQNETGGMSTTIESPDLASIFRIIEEADRKLVEMKAKRIHVDLRIDHRLDKEASIHSKLA